MEMEEHEIHDALIEGIVVGDDELMERYLGDEKIGIDELHTRSPTASRARVFPCLRERDAVDRGGPARQVLSSRKHRAEHEQRADCGAGVQDDRRLPTWVT
jgi:predicted metalloprotease